MPDDIVERLTLRCANYARALEKMRNMLIAVHDGIEDEGDRVYLGSTNHAELIHEAWHLADALKWDEIMRDTQPDTPLAAINLELQAEITRLRELLRISSAMEEDAAALLSDRTALIEALTKIAEGDEPRPVGEYWRGECIPSKHDKCIHGVWINEDCGNCVSEFARTTLEAIHPVSEGE